MRNLYLICISFCLSISILSCKKTSDKLPVEQIKNPVGTWILIRIGDMVSDGAHMRWIWRDIKPNEAFKVTFNEDGSFKSYEKIPPFKGTFTFIDSSIKVLLPDDISDFPTGRTMVGWLKNNILTLGHLVGDDSSVEWQFRLLDQN